METITAVTQTVTVTICKKEIIYIFLIYIILQNSLKIIYNNRSDCILYI